MKDTLLRCAVLALVGVGLAACDDSSTDLSTLGTPSDARVRLYLEVDGNDQFDQGVDDPLEGVTVTLTNTLTEQTFTAESGADGVAAFTALPAGAYTATIAEDDLPSGLVDVSVIDPGLEQTIVAPYEGNAAGVDAAFVFRFLPAAIEGTVYQDADRSGSYDPAIDTTPAPGVTVFLYSGDAASGVPVDTVETEADGVFAFQVYPGTYTVDVAADDLTEVVTDLPLTLTIGAAESVQTTVLVRSAVLTIAEAEARTDSTVVVVDGTVTVPRGNQSSSYFWIQDETGGVKVFVGSSWPGDFVLGDSVRVQGEIVTRFGEKQIEAASIERLGTGSVPDPVLLSGAEFLTGVHQGELVRVDSVVVDSLTSGSSYNVFVTDPSTSDAFIVRIDADTDIGSGVFTPGGRYTVTGVSSPFGGAEQLYPRFAGDILPLDAGVLPIASARGVSDSTEVTVRGVVHTETGAISNSYFFMHDNTAGVKVFIGGLAGSPSFARGDSVEVTGEMVTRFGEKQIEAIAVTPLGTGTVRAPRVVTGAELLTGVTQGDLVTVQTVTVDAVGTGSSYNVTVTDPESATTFIIRVDSDAGVGTGVFTVGNSYTITGVSSPFGGLEQVYPRGPEDITAH